MSENPQVEKIEEAFNSEPIMRRGLILIMISVFVFAMAGAVCGWLLGYFVPDYYRTMFPRMEHDASPASVGIGLGLTQGAIGGLVAGGASWIAAAIFKTRTRKRLIDQASS